WVSISSVWKTFAMPSRRMTASRVVMCGCPSLVDPKPVVRIPLRHVRDDDLVAGRQPLDHLDGVDRGSSHAHRHANGAGAPIDQLEQAGGAIALHPHRAAD